MPYSDACKWCHGRGFVYEYQGGTPVDWDALAAKHPNGIPFDALPKVDDRRRVEVPCDRCGGTGKTTSYRVALSKSDAKDHGWIGDMIHSRWPEYGEKGHCRCCSKPLTGRKTMWCGHKCATAVWERIHSLGWQKKAIAVRDGCACRECGELFESAIVEGGPIYPDPWKLELDHIQPLILGGTEAPENLQLLCKRCHRAKTTRENARRVIPQTDLFEEAS